MEAVRLKDYLSVVSRAKPGDHILHRLYSSAGGAGNGGIRTALSVSPVKPSSSSTVSVAA
jgi:hypothetical protein